MTHITFEPNPSRTAVTYVENPDITEMTTIVLMYRNHDAENRQQASHLICKDLFDGSDKVLQKHREWSCPLEDDSKPSGLVNRGLCRSNRLCQSARETFESDGMPLISVIVSTEVS